MQKVTLNIITMKSFELISTTNKEDHQNLSVPVLWAMTNEQFAETMRQTYDLIGKWMRWDHDDLLLFNSYVEQLDREPDRLFIDPVLEENETLYLNFNVVEHTD